MVAVHVIVALMFAPGRSHDTLFQFGVADLHVGIEYAEEDFLVGSRYLRLGEERDRVVRPTEVVCQVVVIIKIPLYAGITREVSLYHAIDEVGSATRHCRRIAISVETAVIGSAKNTPPVDCYRLSCIAGMTLRFVCVED
jgi:hypothetical protein